MAGAESRRRLNRCLLPPLTREPRRARHQALIVVLEFSLEAVRVRLKPVLQRQHQHQHSGVTQPRETYGFALGVAEFLVDSSALRRLMMS